MSDMYHGQHPEDCLCIPFDEYIERHRETLELLREGKRQVEQGVSGKALDELED